MRAQTAAGFVELPAHAQTRCVMIGYGISLQNEIRFFNFRATSVGEGFVVAGDHEAALFQGMPAGCRSATTTATFKARGFAPVAALPSRRA
jgi:hypothetical protein